MSDSARHVKSIMSGIWTEITVHLQDMKISMMDCFYRPCLGENHFSIKLIPGIDSDVRNMDNDVRNAASDVRNMDKILVHVLVIKH